MRPYQNGDQWALSQILNESSIRREWSSQQLDEHLIAIQNRGGRIWTLTQNGRVAGYALVDPIPGLETIFDLQGCIAVQDRRKGLATHLLGRVQDDLKGSGIHQVAHGVKSISSPAALFLLNQGFFVEHRERRMELEDLSSLITVDLPAGYSLRTLSLPIAIAQFRGLYESSFGGSPWYQPYRSDAEVAAELADAADLIFLVHLDQPIGFSWLRWSQVDQVEIEPIGLIKSYIGRGLGQPFLSAILGVAAQQGALRAALGVWMDNGAAVRLYQKIGFDSVATTTYLACDI